MKRKTILLLAALAIFAAACGSDDSADSASEPADGAPTAIVSLSPTATEMLFAIGADDQVVAVDSLSNFPADAPVTDLSAYPPNVEAIAVYEPDLVVLTPNDDAVISGLEALGAEVIVQDAAADLDEVYAQIAELGAATGHTAEADALSAGMEDDIAAILATVPEREIAPTYYHELDDTLFSVTSSTFIGQLYTLAGLENIADPAETESGPYPQLSEEFLLDADPDAIFLADTICCGQSAATVSVRPGWDNLSAVQAGAITELNDDVASRWGPRVVDLLDIIVAATSDMIPAAT
jgi:iron complex transport system substrate-binding protein